MAQRRLGDLVAAFIGELERDQLGKYLEHAQGARIRNLGRIRIDRAEITEMTAVGKNDRYGNITAQLVDSRRVMAVIDRVRVEIVDGDRGPRGARLETQRGVQFQIAARRRTEVHFVLHRACRPALLRDAGHRGKALRRCRSVICS